MTDEHTKSQKAAATIKKKRPNFYPEIGAIGGSKTPGTFQTKRGLAKKAGIRSGQARKIKGITRKIEELEKARPSQAPDDQQSIDRQVSELMYERKILEIEYGGGHHVEGLEYEQ